jgi:N-methylhydantoinase A/oxoprolinase/acetone carboxylase beta subunit
MGSIRGITPIADCAHAGSEQHAAPSGCCSGRLNRPEGWRDVYFPDAGGTVETAVYDRYALPPGTRIAGPAVFEENESTFVVGPSSTATVLPDGSILTEMPN